MVSTETDRLRVEIQADGENQGTWGQKANTAFKVLEEAIAGVGAVVHDDSANYTISTPQFVEGSTSATEGRNMVLSVTGALTAARNLVVPTEEKLYFVKNGTTDGGGGPYAFTIKTAGGSGISVPNGSTMVVFCDGTNIVDGVDNLPSGATVGGTAIVDLTSAQALSSKTLTSPVINTGVSGTAFIDDDTMATAGPAVLASSESIKAYVDAESVKSRIEAATAAVFQQTAAPTNWTKSSSHNNKALRVVSGTASSGGATAFTTVFGSGKNTGSHALTIAQMPAHTHSYYRDDDVLGSFLQNNGTGTQQNLTNTGSQGSNEGHSHTLSLDLQYMDVIVATKDAY